MSTRTTSYVKSCNQESGFQGKSALLRARSAFCLPKLIFPNRCLVLRLNPEKAAAIDAVMEVLSVSHTVVSTKDRTGKLKYEALVLAAVFVFFCRTFN